MNKKLIGAILLIIGIVMGYFAYRGIFITKGGMIEVSLLGALAGACIGGAFSVVFGKKKQ